MICSAEKCCKKIVKRGVPSIFRGDVDVQSVFDQGFSCASGEEGFAATGERRFLQTAARGSLSLVSPPYSTDLF
jgi:hypothetical protein